MEGRIGNANSLKNYSSKFIFFILRVKRLAQRYREAGPVTGLGFFEVKLSIILAMASVTLTYMIFLLQSGP